MRHCHEAHDAFERGSSQCISWHQVRLILTARHVRYRIDLWDNRSIGEL